MDEVMHAEKQGPGTRLSLFARRLLAEWRKRGWETSGGGSVVVAVSGGADSTALLAAVRELQRAGRLDLRVTAAHFNHRLRGEQSDADARWVEALARALGFEFVCGRADVKSLALRDNLEQAARRARYEFLRGAAEECGARAVLTAHTLDDQAETVLLRLLRGAGARGLLGIHAERRLEGSGPEIKLLRPLVGWARRADTEDFCRERGLEFRRDAMNEDESFARVRVRRRLIPLLETFNPRAAEALARTSELLSEDSAVLDEAAGLLLDESFDKTSSAGEVDAAESDDAGAGNNRIEDAPALRVEVLRDAPKALRRRALRRWLEMCRGDLRRIELVHVRAVERLLEGSRGGRVAELPGGGAVVRRKGLIRFSRKAFEERGESS